MSSLDDYLRKMILERDSSDQPLVVRYGGELLILPPDGCKYMCRHCRAQGIPVEEAVFDASLFGEQHGDRCQYAPRLADDEEPTLQQMREMSLVRAFLLQGVLQFHAEPFFRMKEDLSSTKAMKDALADDRGVKF